MEDNLKIFKVEYLRKHLLDCTQILNLVEYLSNNLLDHTQILNLSSDEETRLPPMEGDLKILKSGISPQPLIGLYSNFKLKLRSTNNITTRYDTS